MPLRDLPHPAPRPATPAGAEGSARAAVDPQLAPTRSEEDGPDPSELADAPARIGRYLVLHVLGRGGMGVVYAAYDPTLDRKVALKLLSAARHGDARLKLRLQREAQALARLSHPNVVTVHDVGVTAEQIYIAMEFVEGGTLHDWLCRAPRTQAQILEVFHAAGRGLIAAHEAGLVHRDFKPDNVLVGKDGRVRVGDFGLVRLVSRAGAAAAGVSAPGDAAPTSAPLPLPAGDDVGLEDTLDSRDAPAEAPSEVRSAEGAPLSLTRTGQYLGTPTYMAPEQFVGDPSDPRSDQFSFCVALYEALYEEAPFFGDTLAALAVQVLNGRVREARAGAHVPPWLRRVLLRGLSVKPEERYPSMEALLLALAADPRRVRARAFVVGAGLLALCCAGAGLWWARDHSASLCRGAPDKLRGIWDAERKPQVQRALLATHKPYAADVWQRVEQILDGYARAFVTMHSDACRATHVRGEQSPALLDLRMGCLERRRQDLQALTALLLRADAAVLEKAVQAGLSLPAVDLCADTRALSAPLSLPEDGAGRARAQALYQTLAHLQVAGQASRYQALQAQAQQAVADAERLGHQPLIAEARYLWGDIQQLSGDQEGAQETLFRAAVAGVAGRHHSLAARAWALLAVVVGYQQRRPEQGLMWGQLARAAIDASGGDERIKAQLLNSLGNIYTEARRYTQAEAALREALALHRRLLGPQGLEVGDDLNDLGLALRYQDRLDEALQSHRQALEIQERALGPQHPALGTLLRNIALVLREQHRYDEALGYLERARALWQRALGAAHQKTLMARTSMAVVHERAGDLAGAQRAFEEILALRTASDESRAATLTSLGAVLGKQGRHAEALARHKEALLLRRASAQHRSTSLSAVGVELLALGRAREALAPLQEALALEGAGEGAAQAQARAALAQALWGRERERALRLAREAQGRYAALLASRECDDECAPERARLEAWLARVAR